MTDTIYIYGILGFLALLAVLAIALKLEKLVQIIMGNYVLSIFFLMLGVCIDFVIATNTNQSFASSLANIKVWLMIVLYLLILFFGIYRNCKLRMDFSSDPLIWKPLYVIYVPLSILSILMTLGIITLGPKIFSIQMLNEISTFTKNIYLQKIIVNFPYILFAYSIVTLLVIVDLKLKINIKIKSGPAEPPMES